MTTTRPPPVDFSDIDARARAADPFAGRFPGDRLVSADGRTAVVMIFLATAEAGAAELAPIVDRVKAEVAALRARPARRALEVGYAGDVAIAVEELSALESDVAVSALLVLIGVVLSILLVFRVPRALPALALPLAVGTVWGFGVASFFVSSLGSSTAFLGSIVDRQRHQPRDHPARPLPRGAPPRYARRRPPSPSRRPTTWRGTLAAAVAAAAGYASLATTSFRGFNEFGVIASSGALTCWLATYLFLPRLLRHVDRGASRAPAQAARRRRPSAVSSPRSSPARAGRTLAVSLALIGVAAILATRLDATPDRIRHVEAAKPRVAPQRRGLLGPADGRAPRPQLHRGGVHDRDARAGTRGRCRARRAR